MSRIVKKEIVTTVPVSNPNDLSTGFQDLKINDSDVIKTTTAKCVLIGTVSSPEGEIFAVSPDSIIEEKLNYDAEFDDIWDSLMKDHFAAPFIVQKNKKMSVFGIYDSDFPYEYRVVLDESQRDYYLGTGIQSPYNNIRYVFSGYVDTYPNLILAGPNVFSEYNTAEYISNLIHSQSILSLNVDRSFVDNPEEYTTVEIYSIYSVGAGTRVPIEYRLVFDVDRRRFYSDNSITEDENYRILEAENTERITSDGFPIVNNRFLEEDF